MRRARTLLLVALSVFFASAALPARAGAPAKPVPTVKLRNTNGAVATIKLAHDLAHWGRQGENPAALALAARVLGTVKTRPLTRQAARKTTGARKAPPPAAERKKAPAGVTPESLLAEAEALCRGNKEHLTAVRIIAKMDPPKVCRAVGGATRHVDMVMRYDTDTYKLVFRGGETAEMAILGDNETDLDLYVYDAKENLVVSDTGGADRCHVKWVPKSTGPFTVKIKNRGGEPNHYTLVTN